MSPPAPYHCKPQVYAYFGQQMPRLETTDGLLHAAIAISMQELPGVAGDRVQADLDRLAQQILTRVRHRTPTAVLAHAHALLFDELGFSGDRLDYYAPQNSYVSSVLERRRGLPITLTLIYKCVLERVGVGVFGIQAPGHFLAEVSVDGGAQLIDPFHNGKQLSRDEALRHIEQITGVEARAPECLQRASHCHWIDRMLRNLHAVLSRRKGRRQDAQAMAELALLLPGGH